MDHDSALHATIPGPWGLFHIAATDRGVVAVGWLTTDEDFEADLVRRLSVPVETVAADAIAGTDATIEGDPRRAHLAAAITALEALLAGRPPERDLRYDLDDRPAWDRHVLAAVADVPWGSTVSYGEIARRVGAPRAARAVGGAVGRNPIGLLIPCHRVIAADGTIGGYGGDAWGSREDRLEIKREMLAREGVTVAPRAG
jgi:methylated-DNA-[protein]-cysteine S-methyltransferase